MTRQTAIRAIATIFLVAGVGHFASPTFFERIMPRWVPNAHAAVVWSGIAEILGAIGLLVPATRVAASWGLIALLVVVFPANVQMLIAARESGAPLLNVLVLVARLPLQPLMIWWVWRAGVRGYRPTAATGTGVDNGPS